MRTTPLALRGNPRDISDYLPLASLKNREAVAIPTEEFDIKWCGKPSLRDDYKSAWQSQRTKSVF
ncbi:MAG: hypothetical protein ACI4MS_02565, partial [Candidatus Coproplasma sp.]